MAAKLKKYFFLNLLTKDSWTTISAGHKNSQHGGELFSDVQDGHPVKKTSIFHILSGKMLNIMACTIYTNIFNSRENIFEPQDKAQMSDMVEVIIVNVT